MLRISQRACSGYLASSLSLKEFERPDPELVRELRHRVKSQVPFAAFDGAEVGPVVAEVVRELLLRAAASMAERAEVLPERLPWTAPDQAVDERPMAWG